MAEKKQPLILALGRGYNGFYCPKTRFHLVGVIKPSAPYPDGLALSEDVKRGLRGGTLVDVNKVLKAEDIAMNAGDSLVRTSSDLKREILVDAENAVKKAKKDYDPEEHDGKDDTYVAVDFSNEQGELISESDILSSTRKDLMTFIADNEIKLEGINSRSTHDEIQQALLNHFGYNEKPEDFNDEKEKK